MSNTKIQMSGRPRHRSRSLRRVKVVTPGRKTVTHYEPKAHSKHICAICKSLLHGKPRGRPVVIKKTPKGTRRPIRPFGGMLCSACSRRIITMRAKINSKQMTMKDVPLSLRQYVGAMRN